MATMKGIQLSRSLLPHTFRSSCRLLSSSFSSPLPSSFPINNNNHTTTLNNRRYFFSQIYDELKNYDKEWKANTDSEDDLATPPPGIFPEQPVDDLDKYYFNDNIPKQKTRTLPNNPFLPPTNTFIPAGKSWNDLHPSSSSSSSSSAIIPSNTSSSSGPASQPYIYQSGGFIPATSISALAVPGSRGSVSGIVATVFGGYGFLGRHILAYLGRIGSQMIVPYRGSGFNVRRTKLAGELGQVVPIPYDWTDLTAINKSLQRSNVVINAMGAAYETTNYSFDDVHVKCTYKIAEAAKKSGNVERFIHISAIGADPRSPSAYLRSKGEGENIVRHFFPDATILRLAPVFGSDDHFINEIGQTIFNEKHCKVFNGGRQLISPVYVNDVAQAVLASIAFGESLGELYHLTGPKTYTYAEIINAALKAAYADPYKHYDLFERQGLYYDLQDYWTYQQKRQHLTDHKESEDTVTYFLRGFFTQLAQVWRTNPDIIPQSYVHQIIPNDIKAKTLFDLGIPHPTTLDSHIENIMLPYRGTRGPERFIELERKTFSPTEPLP